jgi:hypothetical protein
LPNERFRQKWAEPSSFGANISQHKSIKDARNEYKYPEKLSNNKDFLLRQYKVNKSKSKQHGNFFDQFQFDSIHSSGHILWGQYGIEWVSYSFESGLDELAKEC